MLTHSGVLVNFIVRNFNECSALIIKGRLIFCNLTSDIWIWKFFEWNKLIKFFQYFAFGVICSTYKTKFFIILNNTRFLTFIIIGWISSQVLALDDSFNLNYPYLRKLVSNIPLTFCAILTVIAMFHSYKEHLTSDHRLGRILQYIGKRTLDIYMIHFFFLPNLLFLQPFLKSGNMIAIQIVISLAVSIIIVALCLLVSAIIRRSSFLEYTLFGVKKL